MGIKARVKMGVTQVMTTIVLVIENMFIKYILRVDMSCSSTVYMSAKKKKKRREYCGLSTGVRFIRQKNYNNKK